MRGRGLRGRVRGRQSAYSRFPRQCCGPLPWDGGSITVKPAPAAAAISCANSASPSWPAVRPAKSRRRFPGRAASRKDEPAAAIFEPPRMRYFAVVYLQGRRVAAALGTIKPPPPANRCEIGGAAFRGSVAEMEGHRARDAELDGLGDARWHKTGLAKGIHGRGLQDYAVQQRGLRQTERLRDDGAASA